jgi:uracil-DNA glycosylase
LPESWRGAVHRQLDAPLLSDLMQFVADERAHHTVFPPQAQVFTALETTPLPAVRAVILGQDPYHGDGQAHGLAFSVPPGIPTPPSLRNIFAELQSDLGVPKPTSGSLLPWARQGVLLLNTVLTVRSHAAHSHKGRGWEAFTDAVLRAVNDRPEPVIFLLWGAPAQKKRSLIDTTRHTVLEAPHPSPLSAYTGFFGSRPFSRANAALVDAGRSPIDWTLP